MAARPGLKTSKLMTAIREKNLDAVIAALREGDDVEEADIHGFSGLPLRTACFEGDLAIIQELLNSGADVNALSSSGSATPLRLALRCNHREIAAELIKHGAEIPPDLMIDSELLGLTGLSQAPAAASAPLSETPSETPPPADMAALPFEVSSPVAPPASAPAFAADTVEALDFEPSAAAMMRPTAPVSGEVSLDSHANLIEFNTDDAVDAPPPVHILSGQGTETNVLTMELMRFNDEREEAALDFTQQSSKKNDPA